MDKPLILGVVAALALGAGAWFYFSRESDPPVEEPVAAEETPAPEGGIRNPLPEVASAEPLPVLDESDQPLTDALANLLGADAVMRYLVPKNLIRNIVVTVDNLPRRKMALQVRPIAPMPGQPATTGSGEVLTLSGDNFARYAPFIKLVEGADTQQLTQLYLRYYPLFQEAYEGLGYPGQYFNDRLVEVIDHLLATPELTGPIEVVRPSVMYQFADPALEGMSVGQKTLLRIGNDNAAVVKRKLRDLRAAIANQRPAGSE